MLASGLNMPNGVAFRDGALYVAEVTRVLRYDDVEPATSRDPPTPEVVSDAFPSDTHHGWKFIALRARRPALRRRSARRATSATPPGPLHATITRIDPPAAGLEVFARGVRNSVGFDWHPETGELWFTDNGRDWLGDDVPPDELNHAPRAGMHFGFPYCHGGDLARSRAQRRARRAPSSRRRRRSSARTWRRSACASTPARCSPRSTAAASSSPSTARGTARPPIGYRVTFVKIENGRAVSYEPFAEGWLQGSDAWGRPVDVLVMPDGALLVSDDKAGRIYRITYAGS